MRAFAPPGRPGRITAPSRSSWITAPSRPGPITAPSRPGPITAPPGRRGRIIASAVATALPALAAVAVVTAAPAANAATGVVPTAGGTYQLIGSATDKCLDITAGSADNGALLQQWSCSGATHQQFRLVAAGSGRYNLVNVRSTRCLDVPSGTTASGVQLQQWGCGDGQKPQQLWTLTASGTGTYQIANIASGLCMSIENASTASGTRIIQEACTANSNKRFAFVPPGGTGTPPAVPPGAIVVAADGSGHHRTVQAAVNAAPANSATPVTIAIKPGTYRGVVSVPSNRTNLHLLGLGTAPANVVIVENHSAGTVKPDGTTYGTNGSATATVSGTGFTATNLTIANDFDEVANANQPGHQAVALYLNSDRSILTDVRLLGDQDTFLIGANARSYVRNSYIEGTVDFIFGDGIAVLHSSQIHEKRATGGPLTAARTPATRAYGFLFYRCNLTSSAAANSSSLGRPWGPDAQVLYRESTLGAHINTAQPWTNMSSNVWQNARFLEYRNTGPGAGVNGNRPQLSDTQAPNYTPQRYLAGSDGWNPVG